nr:MAG TPA: hypothetical protein [Caudoviricetes sp.]
MENKFSISGRIKAALYPVFSFTSLFLYSSGVVKITFGTSLKYMAVTSLSLIDLALGPIV